MKRRNFLKLLPVGLLSVRFGGLVGSTTDKIGLAGIKGAKAGKALSGSIISVALDGQTFPAKASGMPTMITSKEQMEELYGKGSLLSQCYPDQAKT